MEKVSDTCSVENQLTGNPGSRACRCATPPSSPRRSLRASSASGGGGPGSASPAAQRRFFDRASDTSSGFSVFRFFGFLVLLWSLVSGLWSFPTVYAEPRTAKVAGQFYPDDPQQLRALITHLLEQYPAPDPVSPKPRALILPHAGYSYSGPVAARGFREIQGRRYDAVVVVGFMHRQQFAGTSADDREAYRTPLGTIPVDLDAVSFLGTQPGLHHQEEAHESPEHSLEVMLPFLQVALGDFHLVPLLMGSWQEQDAEQLAAALAGLAAHGDYLFVFSTDLSHYHPYEDAVKRDERTTAAMTFETARAVGRLFVAGAVEACGRGPITAGLSLAERLGYLQRRLLLYENSGDTTGETSRVVGYAAIGMYARTPLETQEHISAAAGQALVRAARAVISAHLSGQPAPPSLGLDAYPELARDQGLFVTLRKHGELRGCIGRIENHEVPLAQLLPAVALDAALRDPRFPPVSKEELSEITVEASVLTPPAPIRSPQEIVAGRDGVVLTAGQHSGVFLPQVWRETGWTRVEFLRELASQKAGLDPDAWRQAALFTFQDQAFEEEP